MRVLLKAGKQRELIESIKVRLSISWTEFAKQLGVTYGSLISWRIEECLLPEKIFKRFLDFFPNYSSYIEDVKPDNWGQIIAGKLSTNRRLRIPKPPPSYELAEFLGIMLGDGCITVIEKMYAYQVRIALNPKNEESYAKFVCKLVEKVFGIKPKLYYKGTALYVCINNKDMVQHLKAYGLLSGNKLVNKAGIPLWIKEDNGFLAACLRGLIDTDGSVYRLSNQDPQLLRISFKSVSSTLQRDVLDAFTSLGIRTSKVIYNNIHITAKSEIGKYLRTIGFNNLKNVQRLFNLAPWCSEVLRKPDAL